MAGRWCGDSRWPTVRAAFSNSSNFAFKLAIKSNIANKTSSTDGASTTEEHAMLRFKLSALIYSQILTFVRAVEPQILCERRYGIYGEMRMRGVTS